MAGGLCIQCSRWTWQRGEEGKPKCYPRCEPKPTPPEVPAPIPLTVADFEAAAGALDADAPEVPASFRYDGGGERSCVPGEKPAEVPSVYAMMAAEVNNEPPPEVPGERFRKRVEAAGKLDVTVLASSAPEVPAPDEVWHIVDKDGIMWRGYTFADGIEAKTFCDDMSASKSLTPVRYVRAREGGR